MKIRVSFLLSATVLLLSFSSAAGAEPGASKPRPRAQMSAGELRERRMKQLDERLQLTDEQKEKINAIWDDAAIQAKAIQGSYPLIPSEKPKKLRALALATRDRIRALLTPVQLKVFDTMAHSEPEPRRTPGSQR